MVPEKLPEYVILVRWGTFRLDLVGRGQIIVAIMLMAAVIGLRMLVL
jgi:hypothetical protein